MRHISDNGSLNPPHGLGLGEDDHGCDLINNVFRISKKHSGLSRKIAGVKTFVSSDCRALCRQRTTRIFIVGLVILSNFV